MSSVGIDLGTTNSLIAAYESNGARLFKNSLGSFLTPSVVSTDRGEILVGQAAKDRLVSHPSETVANFKRLMGTRTVTLLGGKSFFPEELSALVLRKLKADAEADLGTTIETAVISVPAYFNNQQRKSTIDAARLAGLQVDRLVNEPTAAALAFGVADKTEGTFLILDLGGGTFDVSILERYEDVLEVKATTGDTRLGGEDFTDAIEKLILRSANVSPDRLSPMDQAIVRRQADQLKHGLTKNNAAEFSFTLESENKTGSVSRDAFEVECETLLKRIRQPVERAVRDSQLNANSFDSIILVGGATRMPMIRSLTARMFGRLPLVSLDPDTTVAIGAATQAGLIDRQGPLKDVVMTDVCPHTLGIEMVDDEKVPDGRTHVKAIIERNAVVPISRSQMFFTIRNLQKFLAVRVYQGENLRPENNVHVGTIDVPVLPRKAGEESVEVRFTYDVNGVLQVEATAVSTKIKHARVFMNETGLSEEEVSSRFASLGQLKLHPREHDANKAVVARAERLYEEALNFEREEIRLLIAAFEEEISDQKLRSPELCRQHYNSLLDSFEKGNL